jgi:hypothetical protein
LQQILSQKGRIFYASFNRLLLQNELNCNKKMKSFLFSLLFLVATLPCSSQSCANIKKAYAYYNVSMPGIQMADENGNPVTPKPNITRFIYVEYSGTKIPDIKTVLYNASPLSFSVISIKEKVVSIGDNKLNPNNSIAAKKGNYFLKIDLQPADGKTMPDTDCKSIIIKIKAGSKLCKFYVLGEKEFATPPSY